MYAVKIALIDAAFRAGDDGGDAFALVKSLDIRFEPPKQAVVSNTFIKIRREPKDKKEGPAFISSVAFREMCHYQGDLTIAFDVSALPADEKDRLRHLLAHINYFGKRGSFFQYLGADEADELRPSFSYVEGDNRSQISRDLVIQYLDDLGQDATFDRISTFSDASARVGRDRVIVPVALPYRRVASSRGYTHYERTV